MTHVPTLADKVAFLRDPASYPGGASAVESIETHFAWIFLTQMQAYKLKKPVRHEQMDYRTLAARERGCREEVRLNRRLAPSVYEDVVPLSERNGALVLGSGERVHDWLVKMKRLPAPRMLDHALRLGELRHEDLERVALTLVRFFGQAAPATLEGTAYVAKSRMQVRADRAAIRTYGARLPQDQAAEVERLQLDFIARANTVLAERGAEVVEGHGDLRAEHVYLGPPVAVIDCLEFDRTLRLLDPAEELALLSLEIEQLGFADLAEDLLARFQALSVRPVPRGVVHFYASRRATIRAKLAAWHLDDPQFPDPRPWIARTESSLTAAAGHAERALRELDTPGIQRSAGGQR